VDLLSFVNLVLRRWWLFVLFGLLGLGAGYLVMSATPRRYQSTISVQLNPAARSSFLRYDSTNGGASSVSPAVGLAASYIEVLKSRAFGNAVVQKLQIPVAPETITRGIDVKLVPNTNILRITMVWDQPQDAQQLAQSIAEIFIAENIQRQQDGGASRVQDLEAYARQLQGRLTGLRQQRDRLDQGVTRGDLTRLTELNDIDTRLSALETSYANLLVEINQARSSLDTAAILDNASPAQPVGASMALVLVLGLLGGLVLAAALAMLVERLTDAVRTPEDVAAITQSAPLVAVGHARTGKRERSGSTRQDLVVSRAAHSAAAEAFRTLRTNLQLAALEQPLRSIVVTSVGPHEGKTFVATNLGVTLAQAGRCVLLVDADLRRPALHATFDLPNQGGLVAAMVAEHEQSQESPDGPPLVGVVPSGVERLSLLPGGGAPPNPAELLGSATMQRLLARWTASFDIVLIDTPPIGPVADALLLLQSVNATLLVVRSGRTRRSALRGAMEMLRGNSRPLLGIVLNDLRAGPLSRFTTYGYYYAGYYGQDGSDDDQAKPPPRTPAAKRGRPVRQEG